MPTVSQTVLSQADVTNTSRMNHSETTVEPRFNEVPSDWGNVFVISRVHYIENLYLTNFWKNRQYVRYISRYS